ncbi:MAG TPA: TraB/GumN family protein [Vicinamibacterales bacterium]|nr:TraB/GumN family protein [Vicinamibacterales bacterium]
MTQRAWRLTAVATLVAVAAVARLDLAAQSRNFGWKVTSPRGAIYVVGSVHLLTKDFYPLNPALEKAYTDSDLLVEEVDIADMTGPGTQLSMLTRGMQPSSMPLDKVLSPATMALLSKKAQDVGLPLEALKQFKPWMIALTIEAMEWQKAGFDQELGLDKHFFDQAQADGKAVQGLETVEYQLSRFDEMPMDLQDRLLAETLKDIDTEQASMSRLIDAWRAGDAPAVERIVLKDLQQEPQLYQRLLVERNRNWLPKLDALFARQGRAMVVVGAAHLVGPDGLLATFKAKGYRVEQL